MCALFDLNKYRVLKKAFKIVRDASNHSSQESISILKWYEGLCHVIQKFNIKAGLLCYAEN